MTTATTIAFGLQRRAIWVSLGLFLFSGCGGGSAPVTQQGGPNPLSFPSAAATLPPVATPTADPGPPAIVVGNLTANPGATAFANVFLMNHGRQIAGIQTDLSFPATVRVAASADGRPDCSVNPDINKNATSFVFLPNFCSGAACTGLRAIVWASDNIDPIADGSNLFACKVEIDFTATGPQVLHTSQVIMSDPAGNRIDAVGVDGAITVSGEPVPTPTPTATFGGNGSVVLLDQITARPGATANFNVRLFTGGAEVFSTQFDIAFTPQARISAKTNGRPNCFVNPDINKSGTSYAFRPVGCAGDECTSFRTLVISTDTVDPIPDGAILITCPVSIASDAMGTYPFAVSNVIMAAPDGTHVNSTGVDGSITVSGEPLPTETPTPTSPPEPSAAETPTPSGPITNPAVVLGHMNGPAGSVVLISATLVLPGDQTVAAVQNDMRVPSSAHVLAGTDGRPDCLVNPDIDKNTTSFTFLPNLCADSPCTALRALVLATDNVDPIPDGSVLYTCRLEIDPAATGTLPLLISNVVMSDPYGNRTPDAEGVDGAITVIMQ